MPCIDDAGRPWLRNTHRAYSSREHVISKPLTWFTAVRQSLMMTLNIVKIVTRLMSCNGGRRSWLVEQLWLPLPQKISSLSFVQFNCRLFLLANSWMCAILLHMIQCSSHDKYLRVYVLVGNTFKVDMTNVKRKYYGCFNSILLVCGKHNKELMSLYLIKSYCLPQLLHACQALPFSSVQQHELNVIWNNAFCRIFNCCWRASEKTSAVLLK